ncbi:hypothetical protein GPK34_00220 [Secundilactobacillus kimchicus]|uniref:hypothetical protein n=1 Tax=Secundilactobacillus kimchicus TaxID=528209 RepID=UPI001C019D48|nr:hypothetical protein [Secundilactobacillus kimchicus]MBT9670461.1 hypothetical protein [Secundilactobacillus kimchicus]
MNTINVQITHLESTDEDEINVVSNYDTNADVLYGLGSAMLAVGNRSGMTPDEFKETMRSLENDYADIYNSEMGD